MNTLKSIVVQDDEKGLDKRFLVKYDKDGTSTTEVVNYSDLTTEEKATYDAFKTLAESKMI